jgi:murein DD-endopeptidase MepM/ murein hydrolase activator NlpD
VSQPPVVTQPPAPDPNRPPLRAEAEQLLAFADSIVAANHPIPAEYDQMWAMQEQLGLPDPFDVSPTLIPATNFRRMQVNGFGPNSFAFTHWQQFYRNVTGMHNGLDHIVPLGTPLLAVADGVIVGTQQQWPFLGNAQDKCLILWPFLPPRFRDANGRRMLSNVLVAYAHMHDNTVVQRNTVVSAGQVIGIGGRPFGASDNDHLHLEVHLLSGDDRLPRIGQRRLLTNFKRPQPFDNSTPFNPILFFSKRLVRYHLFLGQTVGVNGTTAYPSAAKLSQLNLDWGQLDYFSIASYQYRLAPIWTMRSRPFAAGIFDLATQIQRFRNYAPFVPYPADFLPS